jgi:lipoyl-dependent peroxiredoxin
LDYLDYKEIRMAERRATVVWTGNLTDGAGKLSTGSGTLNEAPVTWASRVENSDGKTSPEELLAGAQAECYAMVLTNMLSGQGNTPTRLEVTAICTVERQSGGLKITTMDLEVRGEVGVNEQEFRQIARDADAACPVSNALRGNVEIRVSAELSVPAR